MRIVQLSTIIISVFLNADCYSMDIPQKIGAIAGLLSPELIVRIKGEPTAITNNPYKDQVAHVRQGTGISEGEKKYLTKRLPIVKKALEKLVNRTLEEKQIPTIAMINSGGGYRAMLCTVGSLLGAKKIGLLDAITYLTALSGSTWAIAPWISTGMSLKEFKHYIIDCAAKPFTDTTDNEESLIFDAAIIKSIYNQPKTPVDLYGALLGNRLLEALGNQRHMTYLSEQAEKVETGRYPYPIYTAIDANEEITTDQTWYEFTPHEIGNPIDKEYIPSWAYGRKFKGGKSTDNSPEKNLSYHLGTFGSAFGANVRTMKKEIAKKLGDLDFIDSLTQSIEGERPFDFYAKIANYTYKMNPEKKGPKNKSFVDAGLDHNNPVSPVIGLCPERKADILIICDASAGDIGKEMKKVVDYAQKHNLPFPTINFEKINKKTISVFKDKNNPNVPTVIYLPRISDQQLWENNKSNPQFSKYNLSEFDLSEETNNGFAATRHFQYDPRDSQKVIAQTKFNMHVNQAKIIKTINWAIDRK